MESLYTFMIIALAILAIADLVVGVSNDAVNFLNSAVGSKAISFKTIMIVASLGIACGALFSSGLMEVARKGIFIPSEYYFSEIMIIFMAVMLTDILLLDFFNSIGMPTSTTVSIVFELLGAALAIAAIKIFNNNQPLSSIINYINTEKATEIVFGIVISVIIAFVVGALVQYVTRLILTFKFNEKPHYISAIYGGLSLSAISYFIIIEGLKSSSYNTKIHSYIDDKISLIIIVNILLWSLFSFLYIKYLKNNIYKLIITVGTFALALSFAGNDLVNFIGVPIAAWQSFQHWIASGVPANSFAMTTLAGEIYTPTAILITAGLIMIISLWFSNKAKKVIKTSVDLSRQGIIEERFDASFLSRIIVNTTLSVTKYTSLLMPNKTKKFIDKQFEKPITIFTKENIKTLPAFDLVRASINLVVASILISVATSMKLPLSTTYVTFMVAMGTSLADRAWGAESAVYRIAGVLNVISGWFATALIAFLASAIVAVIIYYGGFVALTALVVLVFYVIIKSYLNHKREEKNIEESLKEETVKNETNQTSFSEEANKIATILDSFNTIYAKITTALIAKDLNAFEKIKATTTETNLKIESITKKNKKYSKNQKYHINVINKSLKEIALSTSYLSKISYRFIANNDSSVKKNQREKLNNISLELNQYFLKLESLIRTKNLKEMDGLSNSRKILLTDLNTYIQNQIEQKNHKKSSTKKDSLYFNILLETKDIITTSQSLLDSYLEI